MKKKKTNFHKTSMNGKPIDKNIINKVGRRVDAYIFTNFLTLF